VDIGRRSGSSVDVDCTYNCDFGKVDRNARKGDLRFPSPCILFFPSMPATVFAVRSPRIIYLRTNRARYDASQRAAQKSEPQVRTSRRSEAASVSNL
jgi:hypothetical protein